LHILRITAPSSLINSSYDLVSPPLYAGATPLLAMDGLEQISVSRKTEESAADGRDSEEI